MVILMEERFFYRPGVSRNPAVRRRGPLPAADEMKKTVTIRGGREPADIWACLFFFGGLRAAGESRKAAENIADDAAFGRAGNVSP